MSFLSRLFGGCKCKELGKVIHYFDKIQVMVIALNGSIKVGDKIKIKRGDEEFEETINSMQINHQDVGSAGKGQEVAIKISRPTKDGALVYRV